MAIHQILMTIGRLWFLEIWTYPGMVLLLLYGFTFTVLRIFWKRYPVYKPDTSCYLPGVSVIVCFRNERKSLPGLLDSLLCQDFPVGKLEILLVDDHSDDGSEKIAREYSAQHAWFHYLPCPPGMNGKKAAMTQGIRASTFDLILTTDADCVVPPAWVTTHASFHTETDTDLTIGLVEPCVGNGFVASFQEAEFISLVASGASAAAGGRPVFCNGANLSFRKSIFIFLEDPLQGSVMSGDDTLFMLTVKQKGLGRIRLLKSPEALVKTHEPVSMLYFLQQRSRWASKSRHYRDPEILFGAWLVLLLSLVEAGSLFTLILGFNFWLFPLVFAGKSILDFFFLKTFMRFLGKEMSVYYFVGYELIYPFYILTVVVLGLSGKFSWKGRRPDRKDRVSSPARKEI